MAIAISGIISVTVIIVALVMSAAYITTNQKKERPKRRATQEEIDQFFESYECCTRVINWVDAEQQPDHSGNYLVTEVGGPFVNCERATTIKWFDIRAKVWQPSGGRIIAWAEMPKPYKKPSMTA